MSNSNLKTNEEPERDWAVSLGKIGTNDVLIRFRTSAPNGFSKNDYATLVHVIWPYEPESVTGMPTQHTYSLLRKFEQAIAPLEREKLGVMMVAMTGNNARQWFFYIADLDKWAGKLNAILEAKQPCPIDIAYSAEPDWATYTDLMSNIKKN